MRVIVFLLAATLAVSTSSFRQLRSRESSRAYGTCTDQIDCQTCASTYEGNLFKNKPCHWKDGKCTDTASVNSISRKPALCPGVCTMAAMTTPNDPCYLHWKSGTTSTCYSSIVWSLVVSGHIKLCQAKKWQQDRPRAKNAKDKIATPKEDYRVLVRHTDQQLTAGTNLPANSIIGFLRRVDCFWKKNPLHLAEEETDFILNHVVRTHDTVGDIVSGTNNGGTAGGSWGVYQIPQMYNHNEIIWNGLPATADLNNCNNNDNRVAAFVVPVTEVAKRFKQKYGDC